MKKIKVISSIITIMIMALIFFFSSQTANVSHETSSGIAMKFAQMISRMINYSDAESIYKSIHTLVRKTAHFSLYAMLGVSVANTAFWLLPWRRMRLFLISLAFSVCYAISDEVHQIFVPGRAGMIGDVIIDTCGALCGILLFLCVLRIYKRCCKTDFD